MEYYSYDEGGGERLKNVAGDFTKKLPAEKQDSSSSGNSGDDSGSSHQGTVHAIVHRSREGTTEGNSHQVQPNSKKQRSKSRASNQEMNGEVKSKLGESSQASNEVASVISGDVESERTPLIRPRREGDCTDDSVDQLQVITTRTRGYGTSHTQRKKRPPTPTPTQNSRLSRVLEYIVSTLATRSSSVMVFLVVVVLGIVLSTAANLNLDKESYQIKPQHVKMYVLFLIFVCVMWVMIYVFPQKFVCAVAHHSSLIPSHLLTGVAVFGSVNAISQMLYFVDFTKCSRHVHDVSVLYGIYPFCKAFFIYCQIYLFYRLSRGGIRNCKIPGGNFFIMFTLATNMCIWWTTFLRDASADPKVRHVDWLNHYYFGVSGHDACDNASATSPQTKEIHDMVASLRPFMVTFSLEYALLASGMLFHVWKSIKEEDLSEHNNNNKNWTIWRVGFIIGLLSLPSVVVAYIHQKHVRNVGTAKIVLLALQGLICTVLLVGSLYCLRIVKKYFVKTGKSMKLEVMLLGFSFVGFAILDVCNCFAAAAELKHTPSSEVVWFGLSSFTELIAAGLQFLFIKTAYEHELPGVADGGSCAAAKSIRQFCSFAFVNNIAYWGAKTYELRSSDKDVSEQFFGSYAWFCLSHLAYPLCIFFHFHLAICYANVVSFYSQVGPLYNPTRPRRAAP